MSKINIKEIMEIEEQVEENSKLMDNVVNKIISGYSKDLDEYVSRVAEALKDTENPPTDSELDSICMNLSALIYSAGSMCEMLGIRDDISDAVYKEVYHSKRNSIEGGTIADKNSIAELMSQNEKLTSICFTRAYKIMKTKVDSAQELLSSCKKVVSRRMSEMELTRMGGSGR